MYWTQFLYIVSFYTLGSTYRGSRYADCSVGVVCKLRLANARGSHHIAVRVLELKVQAWSVKWSSTQYHVSLNVGSQQLKIAVSTNFDCVAVKIGREFFPWCQLLISCNQLRRYSWPTWMWALEQMTAWTQSWHSLARLGEPQLLFFLEVICFREGYRLVHLVIFRWFQLGPCC